MDGDWQSLLIRLLAASHPHEIKILEEEFETQLLATGMTPAPPPPPPSQYVLLQGQGAKVYHVRPSSVVAVERVNDDLTRLYLPDRNKLTIAEPHDVVVQKLSVALS